MVSRPRKFCTRQTVYDRRRKSYACMDYLVEGKVVQCSFSESDIYRIENFCGKSQFEIKSHEPRLPGSCGDRVCREFEITKRVKDDLIKRLKVI